jgi:antitoxin component of MazEF toxin-antitoxin module
MSVKEVVLQELQSFSEEKLQKVAEFMAFLRFQERVELSPIDPARDGEIRMTDKEKEQYLEELLAGITEENLHPEIKTGPSVGNEAW